MGTSWSLGVLVGLPILVILTAASVAVGFVFFRWRHDDFDGGLALVAAIGSWLVAAIIIGISLSPAGYYPYGSEYHQWRPVTGTVAEVNKRLVSNGDSMEEKVVFRIGDRLYGCADTRCASVKVDDTVLLKCKRAWQYASVSGYDCRFIERRAA